MLAQRLGVSRALAYALTGRLWSVSGGVISLIFIARNLSVAEQGFYYTFWSVLGLWIFFDLGLSVVTVQFASHERASLSIRNGVMTGEARAHQRLASLLRLAVRWYASAGLLMLLIVLPVGAVFFDHYEPAAGTVDWFIPWVLLVFSSAVNLVIGPMPAILEGSGFVRDVSLMRLLQAVTANVFFWIALALGADLYAAVILNGTMAVFNLSWIGIRHLPFFRDLWATEPDSHSIRWREEIWPFQWRFAASWMSGYFMFQIFNPILFATEGAEEASRMGMSLMISTALALFAQSWISIRSVDYGSLVAGRAWNKLDRQFRVSLLQSGLVLVALCLLVLGGLEWLRALGVGLADRTLPFLPMSLLLAATIGNHVVSAQAAYLRGFKREPFLAVYLAMAILTAALSLIVVERFGTVGMLTVFLASVILIGVCGGTWVFIVLRRRWSLEHSSTPGSSGPA